MANKRIMISVLGGCVSVDGLPDGITLEVRDYDVEGSWDPENISCKKDEDGDEYQEMIFENEEKPKEVEPEENPNKYLNYYKCTCGTEWEDNWSCMCDDRCPECNTSIQCYKSEETETGKTIEHHDPKED